MLLNLNYVGYHLIVEAFVPRFCWRRFITLKRTFPLQLFMRLKLLKLN